MIGLLLRCYPARWRDRYGDEFAALIDDRPLSPFDVADVLLGALDAHLHLRGLGAASEHRKGFAMSLRIGGYAAVLGGALFFLALAGGQLVPDAGAVWIPAIFVATSALLVALVGLSAFQARRYPILTWAAFAIPALGACISLLGLVGMALNGDTRFIGEYSAWYVWSLGIVALFVGSALFGVATWRARALSRAAALALAVGALFVVPLIGGLEFLGFLPDELAPVITVVAILAFAGGWAGLGVSALRVGTASPARLEGAAS